MKEKHINELRSRIRKVRTEIISSRLDAVLITDPGNIFYLSGFTGSRGILLLTRKKLFLFTDFRYTEQAAWEAPLFRIHKIQGSPAKAIGLHIEKENITRIGFEDRNVTFAFYREVKRTLKGRNWVPLHQSLELLRAIKSPGEIKKIEQAASLTDHVFKRTFDSISEGITEKEISVYIESTIKYEGGEKVAFEPIVVSGKRSSMPHAKTSSAQLKRNRMLLLDFGAVFKGYNSDLTRTCFIGTISRRYQGLYGIVLEAQQRAIERVRPNVSARAIDATARNYIRSQGYGEYFGHGLGHGVGINIHELPTVDSRSDIVLQPGMVFTIEPGIYIPGWGGIRIEDVVLVTKKGYRILSKAPKSLDSLIITQ